MKRFCCVVTLLCLAAGCFPPAASNNEDPGAANPDPIGAPIPEIGASVSVRVISQSSVPANVVIRFLVGSIEVRRTQLSVSPGVTLGPIGPDLAAVVEINGTFDGGGATPAALLTLGQNFSAGSVIDYVIPDPNDACPADSGKETAGQCGCGVADTDSDGDGAADCNDNCDNDPAKVNPGICGCGVADTDSDGDGVPDCQDLCPNNPAKVVPGVCGCGIADVDADGDGVASCVDGCPGDPAKTVPGICGCNVADTNSDGDALPDCVDGCPNDPGKTTPGICGCGVSDADDDNDGTPNCNDQCPNSPLKTTPGTCGCDTSETDSDGDGTPDCSDLCPNDPTKTSPGACGCGQSELDGDGDGVPNCNDQCPADPLKILPGVCGCGTPDTDGNNNGTPDCNDPPPPTDTDGDGVPDITDNCPSVPNADQADGNGNNIGDACENRTIVSWRSLRSHTGAFEIGLPLNPTADGDGPNGPTSESRDKGIQRIEVVFDGPVSINNIEGVSVVGFSPIFVLLQPAAVYTPSSVALRDPSTLIIDFPLDIETGYGLPDGGCYTITLSPGLINEQLTGDRDVKVRGLFVDANSDGMVDYNDVLEIKSFVGQPSQNAPQADINLSDGVVNVGDTIRAAFEAMEPRQAICSEPQVAR